MADITFYCAKKSTEWEARGFSYRSADANFNDSWSDNGSCYVTKDRWHECLPSEATHFIWSAPDAHTTSFIDNPQGRYPSQKVERTRIDVVQWANRVFPGKTSIGYGELTLHIVRNGDRGVPLFLKRALKAFALYEYEHHGDCEYIQKFYPEAIRALPVEPIYFEAPQFLPELREVQPLVASSSKGRL